MWFMLLIIFLRNPSCISLLVSLWINNLFWKCIAEREIHIRAEYHNDDNALYGILADIVLPMCIAQLIVHTETILLCLLTIVIPLVG